MFLKELVAVHQNALTRKRKEEKKAMLIRAIRWVEFIYEYEFIYELKDIKMNVVLTFWRHTPIFRPTLISG